MKLTSFQATKVYEYLDLNVSFNQDLSFITGGNGCGKTTIIRLIQALTTPSFRDLNLIPHEKARLNFKDGDSEGYIISEKVEKGIRLKVSSIDEAIVFPQIDIEEMESRRVEAERTEAIYSEMNTRYSETQVVKFLSKIDSPVILGLERRDPTNSPRGLSNRDMYYHSSAVAGRRRSFKGTLGLSLSETQYMVQDTYRVIRQFQDKQNDTLRENMLLSAFSYTHSETLFKNWDSKKPSWKEQTQVLERRKEIESALLSVGGPGENLKEALGKFFDSINSLFKQMETEVNEKEINIEWLINKAQIDRISSILAVIDKHKSRIDRLMTPVSSFLSLINDFFEDSNKIIAIDSVGCLVVNRKDGRTVSIEALSSGERQLLIILVHLIFNKRKDRKGVFIIDEPELSLHLKWQSMFVSALIKANPETQFIMATHSPEIVGEHEDKCVEVGVKGNG